MTHEREHTHAHAAPDATTRHDDIAPGRGNRAAQLVASANPLISGLIQRKARNANGMADGAGEAVASASSSSGHSLPEPIMRKFESSLGTDLSGVRVHTGAASAHAAESVGAKAYTMGPDIHFAAGQYDPSSSSGELLLAHEVAHTVQQRGGSPMRQNKLAVSSPTDSFEYEADRAAEAMVAGRSAPNQDAGAAAPGPSISASRPMLARKIDGQPGDRSNEYDPGDMAQNYHPDDWNAAYQGHGDKADDFDNLMKEKYKTGRGVDLSKASDRGGTKVDLEAKPLTGDEIMTIAKDPAGMRADIAKKITPEHCAQVADAANRAFRAMQLDTVEAVSLFLAHAAVESEAMTSMGARGDNPKVVGKFKGRGPLQLTMDQNYMKTLGGLDERAKQLQGQIAKETDQAKKKKLEQDLAMVSKASREIKADPANAEKLDNAFVSSAAWMYAAGGVSHSTKLVGAQKPAFPGNADTDTWETGIGSGGKTWQQQADEATDPTRKDFLLGVVKAQKRKSNAYGRAHTVMLNHVVATAP